MRHLFIVASAALLLAACGGKSEGNDDGGTGTTDAGCDPAAGDSFASGTYRDPDGGTTMSVEWEQQCSLPPSPLRTGQGEGGLCAIAQRCKQVDCACPSNAKRYAARACNDGFCTDSATACSWALQGEPRLCQ